MLARSLRRPLPRLLSTAHPSTCRSFAGSHVRLNTAKESSTFKEGMGRYKLFVSPFAKVFLGAIFTYQVIYWTWLKLEMDESKFEKNKEVASLEKEARALTAAAKK
ncbi:hypothetical protein BDV59DRAFT_136840 [Aspergillus ambiguus]|uniref:uncharacterized protein n=1 Tax=Aspergillus ambiguus TaxID=176160 RepID=UPI003CCD5F1C